MSSGPFLVFEFDGAGLPLADFTRDHPGLRIDVLTTSAESPAGRTHHSLFLASGWSPADRKEMAARLEARFGTLETLYVDDVAGDWLGRLRTLDADMHNPVVTLMADLGSGFGAPWTHIEDGVIYLRARALGSTAPEMLLEIRRRLAAASLDGQAELQDLDGRDRGVWDRLVSFRGGLHGRS